MKKIFMSLIALSLLTTLNASARATSEMVKISVLGMLESDESSTTILNRENLEVKLVEEQVEDSGRGPYRTSKVYSGELNIKHEKTGFETTIQISKIDNSMSIGETKDSIFYTVKTVLNKQFMGLVSVKTLKDLKITEQGNKMELFGETYTPMVILTIK